MEDLQQRHTSRDKQVADLLEVSKGVKWRESSFQSDDIRITFYHTDPVSPLPKLLFIHGRGSAGATSLLALSGLADRYQVFIPDGRGRGKSRPCPPGTFTIPQLVKDAVETIKHIFSGQPIFLIGHSMGASTAARVAKQCPELVKALVLEDPPWRQFPGEAAPINGLPPNGGPIGRAREVQKLSEDEFLEEDRKLGCDKLPEPCKSSLWAMRVMDVDPIEHAFTEGGIEAVISEAVEGITVPVLILRASHLYPEVAEKVLKTYQAGEEVFFPGDGLHMIHNPPTLKRWLQEIKVFFEKAKTL